MMNKLVRINNLRDNLQWMKMTMKGMIVNNKKKTMKNLNNLRKRQKQNQNPRQNQKLNTT